MVYLQRWHGWCHMKLLPSRKVYACLAVTCHLHFWQNDRDLLRATAVTSGVVEVWCGVVGVWCGGVRCIVVGWWCGVVGVWCDVVGV